MAKRVPLLMKAAAVRIFVGCDPNDCDLEQMMVLEHSLTKRCSLPLEIHWMRLSRDRGSFWYSDATCLEDPGWRTEEWATPFSGFRWGVPAACGFEGRALYMDTDMVALSDVAQLWRQPLRRGASFAARRTAGLSRNCVMLWDCAAAREILPTLDEIRSDPAAHARLTGRFQGDAHVQILDPAWNNIDGENQPIEKIKILHYSDMGTQFSHPHALERLKREGHTTHWFDGTVMKHPRSDLAAVFESEMREALESGRTLDQYRAPIRYGEFKKKSERRYRGNPVTRPVTHWLDRLRRELDR